MNLFARLVEIISKFLMEVSLLISMLALVVVIISILLQVFCRFVLGFSLIWSEEIARYLLIWMTFFGVSVLAKKGNLMMLTMLTSRLPRPLKLASRILADLIVFFFLVMFVYYGFVLVRDTYNMGQKTIVTQIPMGIVYLAIPLAMLFYIVQLTDWNLSWIRNRVK